MELKHGTAMMVVLKETAVLMEFEQEAVVLRPHDRMETAVLAIVAVNHHKDQLDFVEVVVPEVASD